MTALHVSLDLETLGLRPGSTIISIGAVAFMSFGVFHGHPFYRVISRASCRDAGFVEDPATLDWWCDQAGDAVEILDEASGKSAQPIATVLHDFAEWWSVLAPAPEGIWSLGADFDLPLLAEAYRRCGFSAPPWPYNRGRCLRTLSALAPTAARARPKVAHNALDDATAQAETAAACLRALGAS